MANMYQRDYDTRFRGPDQFKGEWGGKQGDFTRQGDFPYQDRGFSDRDRDRGWRDTGYRFMSRDFNRFPGGRETGYYPIPIGSDFGREYGRGFGDRDFGRRDFDQDFYGRDFGRKDFDRDFGGRDFGRRDFGGFPEFGFRDYGRDWGREFDRNFGTPSDADLGFYGESRRTTAGNTWRNYGKRGSDLAWYQGWWRPRADILDEEGNIRVEFELPGVPKDNISLTVSEDFIIVQCVKPESHKEMKGFYYQNERHFGNFYRRLDLPDYIDTNRCSAVLQNGVLKVTCAKSIAGGEGGTKTTEGVKQPFHNKINIREMPGQAPPSGVRETVATSSTTTTSQ